MDQKFIDLAVAQRACLLSKDKAVLAMRKRPSLSNHSLSPRQDWRGQLGSHGHP